MSIESAMTISIKNGRVHLSVSAARGLAEKVLRANGYTDREARIIGDHVLDAALCGYEYSGLPKLLDAIEHARAKLPRSAMRIVRETPVSALFDAGNNNGMLAMRDATQTAIEKAQQSGIALVGVTNSWMSARSAYFVEIIARAGLVGIMTVGSASQVAPLGGAAAVLGTNPIAFGLPGAPNPFVLDMGMSIMTWTELSLHERLGTSIPPGVAIDAQGLPTQDPGRARKGALLYFGGHKGFGLALAMQALAMLTVDTMATTDKTYGYLIIAFKPDLLVPLEDFKRELEALIQRVKSSPRQAGVDEIRIPSERAFREREQRLKDGIEIDERIYVALNGYAAPGSRSA
jgi:LDH2 family malate/lactate/ureidoglycolate dehydrogenase